MSDFLVPHDSVTFLSDAGGSDPVKSAPSAPVVKRKKSSPKPKAKRKLSIEDQLNQARLDIASKLIPLVESERDRFLIDSAISERQNPAHNEIIDKLIRSEIDRTSSRPSSNLAATSLNLAKIFDPSIRNVNFNIPNFENERSTRLANILRLLKAAKQTRGDRYAGLKAITSLLNALKTSTRSSGAPFWGNPQQLFGLEAAKRRERRAQEIHGYKRQNLKDQREEAEYQKYRKKYGLDRYK